METLGEFRQATRDMPDESPLVVAVTHDKREHKIIEVTRCPWKSTKDGSHWSEDMKEGLENPDDLEPLTNPALLILAHTEE